jgi:hypothetical protein
MKVSELIEELKKFDGDLHVVRPSNDNPQFWHISELFEQKVNVGNKWGFDSHSGDTSSKYAAKVIVLM